MSGLQPSPSSTRQDRKQPDKTEIETVPVVAFAEVDHTSVRRCPRRPYKVLGQRPG